MTESITSRRDFLRTAGAFGAAAFASGYLPGDWLLAQAPTVDGMRAQMAAAPIEKSALGPGGTC